MIICVCPQLQAHLMAVILYYYYYVISCGKQTMHTKSPKPYNMQSYNTIRQSITGAKVSKPFLTLPMTIKQHFGNDPNKTVLIPDLMALPSTTLNSMLRCSAKAKNLHLYRPNKKNLQKKRQLISCQQWQ